MENKSNTWFTIIVILLVLIVIGLTGYIVYDKVLDSKSEDNIHEDFNDDVNEEEDNEDIDELGEELFDRYGDYIYSSNNLNYNNLDNEIKLEMALINSEDIIYNRSFSYGEQDENGYYEYYLKVDINDFEDSYKELFGKKSISYDNFIIDDSLTESAPSPIECMKEDNYIVCYPFDGGGLLDGYFYYDYDYSELKNDKLYVYVNHLYVDLDYNVYSDYAGTNSLGSAEDNVSDSNTLFKKYKGKTGVYKLVFSKDVNDSWIWEETQIVKD